MAISNLKPYYSISILCEVAKIDRSAYYKWLNKDFSNELSLKENMIHIFLEYDKTIGYRRMYSEIKDLGYSISEKKIRRLMSELNLTCEVRIKKKFKQYKDTNYSSQTFSNSLNRHFKAIKPNEKYCTDMTFIKTQSGDVCCSAILDLFNRQPFGLAFSHTCNTDLALESLKKLQNQRNMSGSILHSDQGVTYKNNRFSTILKNSNIQQSMSKKGCPYDNSLMENFWGTLKVEKIKRLKKKPKDINVLAQIVEEYFDFYINRRKNSALGNLTPAQYYDNFKQINKKINRDGL